MDAPYLPGFSLSQCQIGKMHYFLGHAGAAFLDQTLVSDYCRHDPAEDVTIAAGQTVVWNSAHNLRGSLYIESGASLTVRCRVGFVGPEAKIVVRGGGELILDNGTIGNYATSSEQECGTDLLLWLGGDGTDGDNSGLISIRNGGGFTSERLTAHLTDGATLHIGPVPVLLDACRLVTAPGSYLCVEPGATFAHERRALIRIDPGTILGLNPAVRLQANCEQDICNVLKQTVNFSAATVFPGRVDPICPGSPVTMTASNADTGTATVTWYKDNAVVSNNAQYTDSPTGTTSVVYRAEVDFGNGCPISTWSFTQPVAPASSLSLLTNNATVCATGTGANYGTDGWFNLNSLYATLRNPNVPANQNMTPSWQDPADPDVEVLRSRFVATGSPRLYQLNTSALRAQGLTSYPVRLCNQVTGANTVCLTCATITINLTEPTFTVLAPALACAGKPVTLTANGQAAPLTPGPHLASPHSREAA